jgi:hypothetical protein
MMVAIIHTQTSVYPSAIGDGGGKTKKRISELGVVVHAYNPSCSGGRGRRIWSQRTALAKVTRPYLKRGEKLKW